MESGYEEWEQIYRKYSLEALGWELGRPREVLVKLVENRIIKKGKALDLCCGAGTNTIYLAKKGFQVIGIDISPKALEYAMQKTKKENLKIKFQVQNFLKLTFKNSYFDFVLDIGCFHHVKVKDRNTFIKGVYRVMKRGGQYLLLCFSYRNGPSWNHFTKEQIIQLFSNHFRVKKSEHISSIEGDGVTRYFYSVLMEKPN